MAYLLDTNHCGRHRARYLGVGVRGAACADVERRALSPQAGTRGQFC